jgi:hypothetical protein
MRVNLNRDKLGTVINDDRADWCEAWALFSGDVIYCRHAGRYASTVQGFTRGGGFRAARSLFQFANRNSRIRKGQQADSQTPVAMVSANAAWAPIGRCPSLPESCRLRRPPLPDGS